MSDHQANDDQSNGDKQRLELLTKNWEIVKDLIKSLGERSWTVKAWGVTVWWAGLGYAVSAGKPQLLWYLLVFIAIVLLIDSSVRLTEEKFLGQTKDIEDAITAIAFGDPESAVSRRISTSYARIDASDVGRLFSFRRWAFWFPYLALAVTTIVARWALDSPCK